MRVHILLHVPFEGVGSIESWLRNRKAQVGYTRFYENASLPDLNRVDFVIAMGGSMSVNDEAALPWLRAEKNFIRNSVERGIPVLGICLGAQLVANALGAAVYPNGQKEIGWFPIEAVPSEGDVFRFPEKCRVFHWHGETFDLPAGALQLARSAGCENQAFQIGRHVIGLQFHLETTPDSARALLVNCANELAPGPYIQTEAQLRSIPDTAYAQVNELMDRVLSYLTGPGS